MQCNIDQRGRKARIVVGAMWDTIGAIIILTGVLRHQTDYIVGGAVVSLGGLFMIFEGVKGWCVVRALGFKTRI